MGSADLSSYLFNSRGCVNAGSNCFMNCLIMSMFGYNQSPFYKIKPINPNVEIINKYLLEIVRKMTLDLYPDTSNLRNLLPKEMRYGQQDTTETFDLIMKVLQFEPISIKSKREYTHNINNINNVINIVSSNISTGEKASYITLGNTGVDGYNPINELFNPTQWDDIGSISSNWAHGNFDTPTYRYTRSRMHSLKGECLVFILNRASGVNQKHHNRILAPNKIKNGNDMFFRFAIILHLSSGTEHGHYITILSDKCGNYYVYDDSSGRKIIDCKFDFMQPRNQELIERNSIMYFYYNEN
jgi:hypothetical protein